VPRIEIRIDYGRCIRCRRCVDACDFEVLEWIDDLPVVANPEACKLCLECEKSCPVSAISHREK
jgi:NAD-dependent dihydropyrimidine dehydrogenase PreA subunit